MARKKQRLHFFGQGRNTPVYDELCESPAYRVLTPSERIVLVDFLRTYSRASSWDSEPVPDGFNFSFAHCKEVVSEKWFYSAIKRILAVGFFDCPPEIQEGKPMAPRRFVPSRRWAKYKPSATEAKQLARFENGKRKRLDRHRKRRTDFRAGLDSPNEEKPKGNGVRGHHWNGVRGHEILKPAATGTEYVDTMAQNGVSDRNKVRGLSIAIRTAPLEGGTLTERTPDWDWLEDLLLLKFLDWPWEGLDSEIAVLASRN